MQNSESDWATEAWVLQEQLLSKRFLYFSEYELAWQCRTKIDCECKEEYPVPNDWTELAEARVWERIISAYTGLAITYGSDKLPAVAGIAQAFQAGVFKPNNGTEGLGKYCAGLWERDFASQLCWKVHGWSPKAKPPLPGKEGSTEEERYRAPSWSWASIDQVVNFHLRRDSSHAITFKANAVYIHCEPRTENPHGAVRSDSYVDIAVRLHQANLHRNVQKSRGWFIYPRGRAPERKSTNSLFSTQGGATLSLDDHTLPSIFERDIFLALIVAEPATFGNLKAHNLILEACEGLDGRECYRRLGFLSAQY
ncbi:hypothetical protein B0J14DRAFT_560391 [Halenospora varia]|nr:hypothetical protein B0J14DRAFT_560391 [Halenospora varia]